MTFEPVDMKLYMQVKDFCISDPADKEPKKAVPGAFSLFNMIGPPKNDMDQVYPKLYLGNNKIAKNPRGLVALGVTHLVNTSMGSKFNQTETDQDYYAEHNIIFHGFPGQDVITFKILPHLRPAADFIAEALDKDEGIVYVHCQQGVSRSATVVLAFLMLKRDMDLLSALKLVREKRNIFPNDGFLKQLCHLQKEINEEQQADAQKM